ncbi:EAL domain-containing protein [Sulfurimonas sp. HSL-1716]|uniref:EAL domain-containing protein n=1 Tax=Hydrocurvibacter sulfurireducens TaxID=3131937 RepID=UPI0031F8EC7E
MIDLKVMLVEDDTVLRERLSSILSREIKELKSYSDASAAIADFKEYDPDLIITDIKMPNMTGLEMISVMKKDAPDIPVIIASAFNDTNLFLDAIKLKVDNFIIKPVDVDELLKIISGIAEKINLNKELLEKNTLLNQYKHIVDLSSYITVTDKKGNITYANDKFCALSGYDCEEIIGSPHNIVRHPDVDKSFFKEMWQTILDRKVWQGVVKNRKKDGTSYYVDTTISPIFDSSGEIKEFISIKKDITDMILNRLQLERDIITDRLTDLPNRMSLQTALKNPHRNTQIMLLDIDRFKDINMLFGIHFGDNVLMYFAQTMQKLSPSKDFEFFRIAADEFIVLYKGNEQNALEKYAGDLKHYIHSYPFTFQDISFEIDFTSVIVSCKESHCTSLENLQRVMEEAKHKRKPINVYESIEDNDKTYKYNFTWTQKIKKAISENRLELFYQPIYDVEKECITKYESLIRLIEPDGTVVTPEFFLKVAKLSRSYRDLTKIVITQAFQKASETGFQFSINLSIEDLTDEDTISFLIEKIQEHDLKDKIIVEVLESEGIENFELIKSVFKRLKNAGFEIAIDDFGSGYSNFYYLASLSIDILKIDGSLIKNIVTDYSSRIIVQSIVMFARQLDIKCVAEFVSDKEIFDAVKELGVDLIQGYYIARPSRDIDLHPPQEP